MRKKILVNASIFSSKQNGLSTYCEQVGKQLCSIDQFEVTFYSFARLPIDNSRSIIIKYGLVQKLISFWKPSLYRLIWNVFVLPYYSRQFDIVYSLSPHGSFWCKNQIITIHDLIGLSHNTSLFQKFYYRFILPQLLKSCKRIVSISNATREVLIENYGKYIKADINTIYNGVDHFVSAKSVKPQLTIPENYALIVGASYPHKNVKRIIDIYQSVLYTENLLIVCSKNSYSDSLKDYVNINSIINVTFLHGLSQEELSWVYKNASINLYLTLEEGFGFPPFEAAKFGTASIISDIPSLREVYKNSLPLVNPHSTDDIVESIKNFQEGDKYLELVIRRSQLFSWVNFRSNWIDLISSVISRT